LVVLLAAAPLLARAQQTAWGQCGGNYWTGSTTCVAGTTCTYVNDSYSQCIPGSSSTTSVASTSTTTSATATVTNPAPPAGGDGSSGTGITTRYWDCCKTSCAWTGKATVTDPVVSCDASNNPLANYAAKSACDGGAAYMCSSQQPIVISDTLSYGYAAVNIAGKTEANWCCACYQLTFTSGPVVGKQLIVQAVNTGGDLSSNQFDLAIPGGGVGIFNGCTAQYGAPSQGWGAQYGGVSSLADCASLPAALQAGCEWRFNWFENADNPNVSWKSVGCPSELTANTGCVRE